MKYTFLRHTDDARRLILIMTGWSTGPALFEPLSIEGWDILVCYSYSDFDLPSNLLSQYTTVNLFAWSLGVAAAEMALDPSRITTAYAVNGTPVPFSDDYGINTDVFIGTAVGLSEKSLAKFQRRMCVSGAEYLNTTPYLKTDDTIPELRNQLLLYAKTKFPEPRLPWRRVYISLKDSIFSEANMSRYWNEYAQSHVTEIVPLETGHFVDLVSLIRNHIADLSKVARSFSAAHDKYATNAVAQTQIAQHLSELVVADNTEPVTALEIGPGAGVFTKMYRPKLNLTHLHLVDIYEISPTGYKTNETFVLADAEQWLESVDMEWDYILSASSIQWFTNLKRFFLNAYNHLKPGGKLICSTFIPGNLAQLDSLRPSPLLYRSPEEIKAMLDEIFDEAAIDTEDITLSFDTPRKALLHLRDTGVAGVGASGKTVARIVKALTPEPGEKVKLTYRPIYISATKKK